MRRIKIGLNRWGEPVYYPESGSYGVTIILARPRYGKSVLATNLYVQIAEKRRLIIFDYQGEHSNSQFPNFRSRDKSAMIPDLFTLDNFGFYMSDFDEIGDWISMGFSEKAAPELLRLLGYDEIHKNNPYKFLDLLHDLPSRDDMIAWFNQEYEQYGLQYKTRINDSIKNNIVRSMANIISSGLVIAPIHSKEWKEYSPNKRHVRDWGELAQKYPHLNINLDIVSGGSMYLARASVGKILEKLLPHMKYLRPLVVLEEGDLMAPAGGDENLTSLYQIRSYVIKHQRTGVEIMIISQDPNLIDTFVLIGGIVWIMGPHTSNMVTASLLDDKDTSYAQIVQMLHSDRALNQREFVIMEAGNNGRYEIFEPCDACTRLPRMREWRVN